MLIWFESSTIDETTSLWQKRWGSSATDIPTDGTIIHNRNFEISDQGELVHKGTFWADEIKKYRDNPEKRLKIAIENLPLPAAFREAAIALRAKIRSKRKVKINFDSELEMLYLLAVIESFSIPYSRNLETPGYNVMEFTPAEVIKNLPFSYTDLGFEKLELLNKTDKKLLVDCWGKPKKHSTLHKLHYDVWLKFEQLYSEHRKSTEALFLEELEETGIASTSSESILDKKDTIDELTFEQCALFDREKKSKTVAYLLLLFLGVLGAHRFYFKDIGMGIGLIILVMISVVMPIFFLAVISWWIIDACLIPKWINKHNEKLINRLE